MSRNEDKITPKALSSREACQFLGVSLSTLRRAIHDNKIKTFRIGRTLRIPISELERLGLNGKMVSLKQAAKILNIGYETARRAVKSGKIEVVRITRGGPYRIRQEELNRIMNEPQPM